MVTGRCQHPDAERTMSDSLPRRVVLTGLGLVTPLGLDLDAIWRALAEGHSGVRTITAFDPSALPVRFGGEIPDFDARRLIDKKHLKRVLPMPRTVHLAAAAAQRAMAHAGNLGQRLD